MEHLHAVMDETARTEIDRQIALEVAETTNSFSSVDDLNERRMVCKFFGHMRRKVISKYKGTRTSFCPYCGEILAYGHNLDIIPDSAAFFFEYMVTEAFIHIKHSADEK